MPLLVMHLLLVIFRDTVPTDLWRNSRLPLVLVLTLTFYRAKPVWMELCGDVPSDLDLLPLSKAHRVILCPGRWKQACKVVFNLLGEFRVTSEM